MIDSRDGSVHIVRIDADDDVDFTAALIDHFDVDIGVCKRGEDARRRSCLIAHTVSDDGDKRDVSVNVNEVGICLSANTLDDLVEFTFDLLVRKDDAHRVDTGRHMFEVDIVVFEHGQDLTAKTDFAVHHGFFDENGRKPFLSGNTRYQSRAFHFGRVFNDERSGGGRVERVLYIDGNSRRLQGKRGFGVQYAAPMYESSRNSS